MQKLNVLGIEINNYSTRESIKLIIRFLRSGSMNTVCCLSADELVLAEDNEELKVWIESMDLIIPAEDILEAAKLNASAWIKDIDSDIFYKEFMKLIYREKRSVFYLAETETEIEEFLKWFGGEANNLNIVGTFAYENLVGDVGAIINEINSASTEIILSKLNYPNQLKIIYDNKMKVNAELWITLPFGLLMDKDRVKFKKLRKLIRKTIFKRIVSQYDDNENRGEL